MSFVYPQFLWALFALAIPILVHLFQFRRFKRVSFTNVRFLQEIRQDTRHRSRLKHLLVLASRLLALTFLVLAFAQPFIPSKQGTGRSARHRVSCWIDNSFSMNARGTYGPLLDVAIERGRDIAKAYAPSDEFQLFTNDFEARDQRWLTRDEFLQRLDEVRPSSAVRSLDEVIRRQHDAFASLPANPGMELDAFLFSDFQATLLSAASPPDPDSTIRYFLMPLKAEQTGNLFIDTCYLAQPFVQPGSTQDLVVRLRNNGEEEVENVPVKLTLQGQQRALSSVTVGPASTVELTLPFAVNATGFQQAAVSITDYPVTFDDTFYFAFRVRDRVHALCINGPDGRSPYLDALYGNDPYVDYRTSAEGQVDYNSFPGLQLIVLNGLRSYATGLQQELQRYMQQGGRVMILPGTTSDAASYEAFAASTKLPMLTGPVKSEDRVSRVESKHPLMSGVFEEGKSTPENLDLPVIHQYYTASLRPGSGTQVVMTTESGQPFLSFTPYGNGGAFLLSVPLDDAYSSFPKHALFVPVFLKSVLMGASEIGYSQRTGVYSTFSAGDTVLAGDQVFHLKNPEKGFDAIADASTGSSRQTGNGISLTVQDQVKVAGNYEVTAGNSVVNVVAFNYDRRESDLRPLEESAMEQWFKSISFRAPEQLDAADPSVGHSLQQIREGTSFWKYAILLALLFLAIEILLIRYFKSQSR